MLKKISIPIILLFFVLACNKVEYITDDSAKLSFSVDTVMFDTVFNTIGSSTKKLMVYNKHDLPIKISSIRLAEGNNSSYRLNINGISSNDAKEIELESQDSMYIFIEVTVDPGKSSMVEQDSIIFLTNGNYQDVDLVAFGREINLINGEVIKSQVWSNEKPYLIYNSVLLDTLEQLIINPGTEIYFHKESFMYIKGSLKVNGTFEEPVLFQGDRLEDLYDEWPGQWGGIHLLNGSYENFINYAIIKNAKYGVRIDTLVNPNIPTLTILNSDIQHHSIAGIYALGTFVVAANCLIADCGFYSVGLLLGGNYTFYQCTIANNWAWGTRRGPALVFNNYLEIDNVEHFWGYFSASFANCIIWGNLESEFIPDAHNTENGMSFVFDHCLARVDSAIYDAYKPLFVESIVNDLNFKFVNAEEFNYRLDTLSPAKDKANIEVITNNIEILQFDLEGNNRLSDENPDIGVYERVE